MPAPGTLLGPRLRVVRELGSGGMGVVVLARDEALERDVAVKLAHPHLVESASQRRRFLEEARAIARVRHPAVVEIFAFGEHAGAPYFTMEYVPGPSLEDHLARSGYAPMTPTEMLGVLRPVVAGLGAIHARGAVHGDLKPANILIGEGFRVLVADFGLSFEAERAPSELLGTPAYTAPERIRGDVMPPALRPRADLYALGVLAWELSTGRVPFDAPDASRVHAQHLYKTPPSLLEERPDLPARVDDAVQALLAKAPTERPASGEELIAALEDAEARAQQPYRSVLLVDDDPDFRALLRACFECELRVQNVVEAGSGPEALEALRGAHYDLVVVDLNLGEGPNGLELTAAIRERHPAHELGILVVTGQGSASDWRVLSRLGADAFVVKPLEPDAFITTARRLLEEG